MRTTEDTERLDAIRATTREALRAAIGDARDVAILDAPNQRNIGDSLIWEGELAYLASLGCTIRHVSDLRGYDADDVRRSLPGGGVVLLHGGGNFGDLWHGHQRLRERIVSELTDFPIVQLPQSIFFRDEKLAAHANEVMSGHPNLTVLLRDSLSMQRAAEQLPGLRRVFCPDMALGYEPPLVQREPTGRQVLVIARADHESASGLKSVSSEWVAPLTVRVTDWWVHAKEPMSWRTARAVARLQSFLVRARRRLRRTTSISLPFPRVPQSVVRRAIVTINRDNVAYAREMYNDASYVVVDRLHAHVLALLMGIPHVMLDNNYRKLGAVYDDYTHQFDSVSYCTSLDDAREKILAMAGN